MKTQFKLDPRDSVILKGIAILAIAFHNYFHFLSPAKENEFAFAPQRIFVFLAALRDPRQIVPALFSFLGHYGVQIFILVSAYGLAIRYWDERPSWAVFVWGRVRKIYPMFVLAIGLWLLMACFSAGLNGLLQILRDDGSSLVLMLLGILNLIPGHSLPPIGPWWFVPFIIQFYCLWPLLRRLTIRFGVAGLIVVSGASLLVVATCNDILVARWSINLLLSPVGRLPVICLGIAMARYRFVPGFTGVVLAGLGFAASNFSAWLWPLGFPCVSILMISAYESFRPQLRRSRLLMRVGECSMALFLVNGFTRIPFVEFASKNGSWAAELVLGFLAVGFAWVFADLLTRRFPGTNTASAAWRDDGQVQARPGGYRAAVRL